MFTLLDYGIVIQNDLQIFASCFCVVVYGTVMVNTWHTLVIYDMLFHCIMCRIIYTAFFESDKFVCWNG